MRKARILVNGVFAGVLEELQDDQYNFRYLTEYEGPPVSLTMPIKTAVFEFNKFPAFFEGLLPEGILLETLLRKYKLDKNDYFAQLLKIGNDVIGAVTIEAIE